MSGSISVGPRDWELEVSLGQITLSRTGTYTAASTKEFMSSCEVTSQWSTGTNGFRESRACMPTRQRVTFSRTTSQEHRTPGGPATWATCGCVWRTPVAASSLQKRVKAMFSSCLLKDINSSSVSGLRIAREAPLELWPTVPKNSSSPMVRRACEYRSARKRSGGHCDPLTGSGLR